MDEKLRELLNYLLGKLSEILQKEEEATEERAKLERLIKLVEDMAKKK